MIGQENSIPILLDVVGLNKSVLIRVLILQIKILMLLIIVVIVIEI